MKLRYIELENFRQYYGHQRVRFGQSNDRNVTLLYGANGSGKTTLLNAFLWALYGELTDDVEEQERLISEHAWESTRQNGQISMSVSVEFEHDDVRYLVKRSVNAQKHGFEQNLPAPQLQMWQLDENGNMREVVSPKSQIDRILPSRLSKFFFVNGERIEHLVRKGAYEQIQTAVKTLLGLETLDRAIGRLPNVTKKLRRKLRSEGNGQSLDELNDAIDRIDQQLQDQYQVRDGLKAEEQSLRDEVELIHTELATATATRELQNERARLDALRSNAEARIHEQQDKLNNLVSHEGYLAFLGGLAEQVHRISNSHRERGDLPAPLKGTFIADLLEKGNCICGTPLVEGSSTRAALEKWRDRIGHADVDEAWSSLHGTMLTFEEHRGRIFEQVKDLDVAAARAREERRTLVGQISDISATLKQPKDGTTAESLEFHREEVLDRLQMTSQKLGRTQDRIDSLVAERAKKEGEIERLNIKGEANSRVQRRIAVVKEVEEALDEVRRIASDGTRKRLDKRIRDIFIPISLKNYQPRLTETFQLEYWQMANSTGETIPAPKSTGENMLLSLAFVAAIAAECRDSAGRGALFPGVGGDFPIVMDAAFGNLDDDYRKHIARFLPDMTPQVIVLTSKAQASGVVEDELRDRVGEQYVITTHTTRADLNDVTERISVAGRDYPYQVVGSDWDGAEFTGVRP